MSVSQPGPADTERLAFRRLASSDLAALIDLHADPQVMRWIGEPEPPAHVAAVLRRWSQPVDPRYGVWGALELSGRLVGWFSLELREPGAGVLGYRLQRRAWGHGLATEGGRAVLGWAFGGAALTRVVAETYERNLASRRVMEKLGMRLAGRFRLDGEALAGQPQWPGYELSYEVSAAHWARARP